MGSLSIWHWIVVIAVVLLLFGRGKISDLMGDVAQGIKAFKKGMQDDEKTAEKPEPVKSIDHNATPSAAARSDVGGPNLVWQVLGLPASRERNFSCSTSGGVNSSSSRLSR
jgi:sec-independent protein translocase protein TatA